MPCARGTLCSALLVYKAPIYLGIATMSRSSEAPAQGDTALLDDAIYEEASLPTLARQVLDESELNQKQAAERLGVSRSALSMALSEHVRRGRNLCIRVVEKFSEFMLDGPLFRLRRASKSS